MVQQPAEDADGSTGAARETRERVSEEKAAENLDSAKVTTKF